jgi:hypothetical protein
MTVVKFPAKASRRVSAQISSRRPRRSKNGTPEERLAKAVAEGAAKSGPSTVVAITREGPTEATLCAQRRMDDLIGTNQQWANLHMPTLRMAGVVIGQDEPAMSSLRQEGAELATLADLCRGTKAHLEELVALLEAAIARCSPIEAESATPNVHQMHNSGKFTDQVLCQAPLHGS